MLLIVLAHFETSTSAIATLFILKLQTYCLSFNMTLVHTLFCLIAAVAAIPAPQTTSSASASVCSGNSASDRSVWCDYSIDTNYYDEVPNTGVIVEVQSCNDISLSMTLTTPVLA